MIKKILLILSAFILFFSFTIWIPEGKVDWGKSRFEICEIEFRDGVKFYFTTFDEFKIPFEVSLLKIQIEKIFLRKISDIKSIKHNHPVGSEMFWSHSDFVTYSKFKDYGFTGDYILIYGNKEVCILRGKKNE